MVVCTPQKKQKTKNNQKTIKKHTSFTSIRNNRIRSHRKITTYRLFPESDALVPMQASVQSKRRPASAGTLGQRGRGGDGDDDVEINVLGCRLTY